MIPVPATRHQLNPYTGRVRTRRKPLLDFHRGSAALGDIEGGLDTHRWTAEYKPATGNVLIYRDDLGPASAVVEINVPNIKRLVFAFDQNMRPVLAWVLNGGTSTFLRYYIALNNAMGVVEFPGITDPCLTLDDSREYLVTDSDVLLGYTRDGYLYLRAQRDNFTAEYPFGGSGDPLELVALSMNTELRIQATLLGVVNTPPVDYNAHSFWRINATAANSHLSIKEIQMAASVGGSNLAAGGTVIASGSYTGAAHAAANAFDGQFTDANTWASDVAQSGWIGYQFPEPVNIAEVRMVPRMEYSQYPTAFTIEHSDNGIDWTVAATYNVPNGWTANTFRSFPVPNPPPPPPLVDSFDTNTIANYTQLADSPTTWSVAGGEMVAAAGGVQTLLVENGTTFANGKVTVEMTDGPDSGVVMRVLDNNNYYLAAVYDNGSSISNAIRLYKRVGGSYTQIGAQIPISFARGTPHTLSLQIIGSNLTVEFDGAVVHTATDGSIVGEGLAGMRHSAAAAASKFSSYTRVILP